MTSDVLLAAHGATRRYGRRGAPALAGVDLTVRAGGRLAVVGRSGAGKTTLTRLLLGLERCDAGRVTYRGRDVVPGRRRSLQWFRRRVQLVPQDPGRSLAPHMLIGEVVREPLVCLGIDGDHGRRVSELLAAVGLDPEVASRRPGELSGGQRQRIAIARALAPRPELLVADEPVSALDACVRASVVSLLRELSVTEGLALVVVSHDLGVVAGLCDSVVVLDGGTVVEGGPVDDVLARPADPRTQALVRAVPRLVLA